MNPRDTLLELDADRARRTFDRPVEVRTSQSGDKLIWDGYASVTGYSYPVYGGPPYGWNETVRAGAFKRTLANRADVSFLINHDGMSLARTRSGTLTLTEDAKGFRNIAELDMRQTAVRDLAIANERGDVNEQSFGFRVDKDEWFDEDGGPSNRQIGTDRHITEINMNKGDVSAVNYGANDAAEGGFRDIDVALAELRAGRNLNPNQRELVRSLAAVLDDERAYSDDDRKKMAQSGEAMPDGSYPIANLVDLHNAIHAVGRGGADHDAIRKHIIARAKALGASDAIPTDWNSDGSLGSQNGVQVGELRSPLEWRAMGMEDHLSAIEDACSQMRDLMSLDSADDSSMNALSGKVTLGPQTETLAALRALWEMKKSA